MKVINDANQLAQILSERAKVIEKGTEVYQEERKQVGWWRNSAKEAEQKIAPTLICIPDQEEDISKIVKFAVANGYKLIPRSGGHQITGFSSGQEGEKTIQLDMKRFADVQVENDNFHNDGSQNKGKRVIVGAGVSVKKLAQILNEHDLHIPMGICSNVCAGGHYQSSAFGLWCRSLGLGIDYVTHVKICLASGEIITVHAADEEHYPLFWALRGGSPGAFGVVIEFQMNAIDVHEYKHAYMGRLHWENDGNTFEQLSNILVKMKEEPAYRQLKDLDIYFVTFPDFYNPYLVTQHEKPKHSINIILGWTGIDSGSIHNKIPAQYLGNKPTGTTFYDIFVKPLKQVPGMNQDISFEHDYQDDSKYNINYMAAICMGSDIVGSLEKIKRDRQAIFPPDKAEESAKYAEIADQLAEKDNVAIKDEVCRYTTITNFASYENGFNEERFIKELVKRVAILEKETPNVWAMIQIFHKETFPNESSGFPTRGDNFAYDIWVVWRPSLGIEVEKAAKKWALETDNILSKAMGENVFCQTWCSKEEADMNNIEHRRLYYPNDEHYKLLQAIKTKYDQLDIFNTKFTVKPLSQVIPIPEMPKPTNLELYTQPLDKNIKQASYLAGKNYNILTGRMQSHAYGKPEAPYLTWINEDGSTEPALTFGKFYEEVASYASWLKMVKKVEKGDRLILSILPGPDFIKVFMACIYIGAIPVPVYPAIREAKYQERLQHIINVSKPKYILVDKDVFVYKAVSYFHSILGAKGPQWVVVKPYTTGSIIEAAEIQEDDIALIQFTSGTTAMPKGAALTHQNLMAQFKLIQDELEFHDGNTGLMWVPPYHDLGLIGSLLVNLMGGNHLYMMSPMSLMKNPAIWFDSIHKFRATHTGSPNFAYSMCLDKISDEQFAAWDLSCIKMMMSAGEPIEQDVMDLLLDKLHRFSKLDKASYCPSYGLAENAVCITMGGKKRIAIDRKELMKARLHFRPDGMQLSSCGRVIPNVPVAIVKDDTEIGEDEIGEIWISGSSLATHYVNDESEDLNMRLSSRHGRWFRTGDIGFIHEGELFVIARAADSISREQGTYYPNILESAINLAVEGLRKGSTTVFLDQVSNKLSVGIEMQKRREINLLSNIAKKLQHTIAELFGVCLEVVHILPPKSSLKTSSGKLQRVQTGVAISNHEITPIASYKFSEEGRILETLQQKKNIIKLISSLFTEGSKIR